MTRRQLAIPAVLLLFVLLIALLWPAPNTDLPPVSRTIVDEAAVGGPAARVARPARPAELPPPVAPTDGPAPTPLPSAPATVALGDTDADGRITGPTDTDRTIYALNEVGMRAAIVDTTATRQACMADFPNAPAEPREVTATIEVQNIIGDGRVTNVYLPRTQPEDGVLLRCLIRSLQAETFEMPRRQKIGLTMTWTLNP